MNIIEGYGNIAPATIYGRLFCLLFGIIGIPFTLSVVADVGGMFATLVSKVWNANGYKMKKILQKIKLRKEIYEDEEDDEDEDWFDGNLSTSIIALLLLFLFLSFGALIFTFFEEWTFMDSFYFCFITMTTIGFGDLVPELDRTAYMLICTIYIFIGMAFTSTIIELVRRQYAESWRKMVELRAQIQAQLKLAETLKRLAEHAGNYNMTIVINNSKLNSQRVTILNWIWILLEI